MKKVKIDIPLELYTDNVRKIIERSLHDLDAEPPYIASFLCDPKFTEKDLETAYISGNLQNNMKNKRYLTKKHYTQEIITSLFVK